MNIKPYTQFFEDSDESDLMKDLEDIGANERTWQRDEIEEVLQSLDWQEYYSVEIMDNDNFDFGLDGERVTSMFNGYIQGEFDEDQISEDVESALARTKINKDVDIDEPFYTMDEILEAVSNVDYRKLSIQFIQDSGEFDLITIDIEGDDRGEGILDISAKASIDESDVDINESDIIDSILDNL